MLTQANAGDPGPARPGEYLSFDSFQSFVNGPPAGVPVTGYRAQWWGKIYWGRNISEYIRIKYIAIIYYWRHYRNINYYYFIS